MNNWKEIDLFNYLVENIYPDLVKAKNQMSRWDCYSPSTSHRIELKCRQVHYKTLLLEKFSQDHSNFSISQFLYFSTIF